MYDTYVKSTDNMMVKLSRYVHTHKSKENVRYVHTYVRR